ncbi:capsule-associated CAP1 [Fusarium albosuccineum]|uniref:Capsule-associated CAP1 n=1 Tax=Fusarium albosuccineum TaxID=1237068 RepID=A0A8H4LBM3_9HYPO|nr:capsule-associated CAP1 [Fusarium albosuccineum]
MTLNAEAQTAFGLGDDIFSQAHPLLTLDSAPLDQQPTTTTTLAPPTTMPSKSPSVPGTSTFSLHPSPSSTVSSKRKHSSDEEEESEKTIKRQRNTIAARKYRQKRLDRISELERALEAMTGERDDLRLQLARREAEVDALREMLGKK